MQNTHTYSRWEFIGYVLNTHVLHKGIGESEIFGCKAAAGLSLKLFWKLRTSLRCSGLFEVHVDFFDLFVLLRFATCNYM